MTGVNQPVTIKRYADRLYAPAAARYVSLEDLARMVENDQDFVVLDARSGEDVTRSVLKQFIPGRDHG
jgi:polyhydroxyalkanoate synthesis repressor PhaR